MAFTVHKTNGGCRDCGLFLLDITGKFKPSSIVVTWSDEKRSTNYQVETAIEAAWESQLALAGKNGINIFDGRMCRLIDCEVHDGKLLLTLGEVSYKEFLGTNLLNPQFRHVYGPSVLANALGTSIVLISSDGFLILGRRSQTVGFHAGLIHPIGGTVEPSADLSTPPDPYNSAVHELAEEAGISHGTLSKPLCIGLVRDKKIVQPELVFVIHTSLTGQAILAGAGSAPDASEHSNLLTVRDNPSSVVNFIKNNAVDMTPVCQAAILLYGLQRWGSGWFAAARGYLQSVI